MQSGHGFPLGGQHVEAVVNPLYRNGQLDQRQYYPANAQTMHTQNNMPDVHQQYPSYSVPSIHLHAPLDHGAYAYDDRRDALVASHEFADRSGQSRGAGTDGNTVLASQSRVEAGFCGDCQLPIHQQVGGQYDTHHCLCAPRPVVSQFPGTMLSAVEDYMYAFETRKQAREYMRKPRHFVKLREVGDDWKDVEKDQMRWANKVFDAIVTLPLDASESAQDMFQTIQAKGFKPEYIEASAWRIVGRTIRIHKHGSELQKKVQIQGKTIDQCKASVRLETIIEVLLYHKNIAKDVLDGWKWKAVVDQPSRRLKLSQGSRASNHNKYKKLEEMKTKAVNPGTARVNTTQSVASASGAKAIPRNVISARERPAESDEKSENELVDGQMEDELSGEEDVEDDDVDDEDLDREEIEDEDFETDGLAEIAPPNMAYPSKSLYASKVATGLKSSKNITKVLDAGGVTGQA